MPMTQDHKNFMDEGQFSNVTKTTALILSGLGFVIGIHGIHRFATGHILTGILQLITFGGCAIWTIIDIVNISQGGFEDSEGRRVAD